MFSGRRVEKNWLLKGMVTHKIIHFCTLTQSLFILGELNSASTLQFWPICKILTDLNNLCRISPDWILKKFGWEQIHPMFTRMKNVSGRKEKNADSEKWENVVERERWILANILQFRSNPLLVLHVSPQMLRCSDKKCNQFQLFCTLDSGENQQTNWPLNLKTLKCTKTNS